MPSVDGAGSASAVGLWGLQGGRMGGGKAEVWPWGCLPRDPVHKEQCWGDGFSTAVSAWPVGRLLKLVFQ